MQQQPVILRRLTLAVLAALTFLSAGCSDGATRIAFELESAAADFRRSSDTTRTLRHMPETWPEGCDDAYTIQFSARSSLLIWCIPAIGEKATSSHTTTYHLRFVKVPKTYIVDKAAGKPTFIELTKVDGDVVITGVY